MSGSHGDYQDRRPRAYVVTDVQLYREALSAHLQKNGQLEFVGAGPPTEATLVAVERLLPEALILDLAMREGMGFAKRVRDRIAQTKIVAFAVSEPDKQVIACVKAGICGYVPKDGTVQDIVLAVVHAVKGELHCTPKFAAMLLNQLAALASEPTRSRLGHTAKLTSREMEILEQINRGLSNKEIARKLRISSATVKNHVHQLLGKLGVRRRTQALAFLHDQPAVIPAQLEI